MATLQWIGISFLLTAGLTAALGSGCGGGGQSGDHSSSSSGGHAGGAGGGGGSSGSLGTPCDAASCDPDAGPNPFTGPPVCSSNTQWTMGNADSNLMLPGKPCVACHNDPATAPAPPPLTLGGTVYQTGHEPDNCNGGPSDPLDKAVVEITDANKQVIMMQVNGAGNFFFATDQGKVAMPFTARVLHQGKARAMMSPQKSGDCNSCHTADGVNGAPGRIALP